MSAPESARECVALVRSGRASALEITDAVLARTLAGDRSIHSFTAVLAERARAEARAVDARRSRGEALPLLAGVPYAVKNLFDLQGMTTLAGAKIRIGAAPALRDAALVRRLHDAGAVVTGALNMDAYAYGFTTENTHFGTTRNPRNQACVAGGSSGGSGAAVAAGFSYFSLASDTNGSIRVPSSFCGVFGLKPTFGRLSRAGAYPFVPGLDHVGPLARNVGDLALVYDALQGHDPDDPGCVERPAEPATPVLEQGVGKLRIAVLGGYFGQWADDDARQAVARAAAALGAVDTAMLPEAQRARAAAFIITAAESGAFYLDELRRRQNDFEPLSRDRLLAGAMLPAAWYMRAQRFRSWCREATEKLFGEYDLLLAPATPCTATPVGAETITLNGQALPARPNIGLLTQPISFLGLPVAVAPLQTPGGMPIGVQLIAAPWREDLCLRAARVLEQAGLAVSPVAQV